jgi:cytochrome d ubiquinol oxidase subunit II
VWLVLVVVMLFTAFPDAFATLGIVLHIPLSLMLLGIVLRGSSFVFRSYGARDDAAERRWGRVFAIASVITPVLLGVIVGAIASGAAGAAAARLAQATAAAGAVPAAPTFVDVFVRPWLAPFPLALGALALAMFAFLAAVYLAVAARDPELREDFRACGLAAAVAVFFAAFGALLIARVEAPDVHRGLIGLAWAFPLQAGTGIVAITAIAALYMRRWQLARVAAAAQVSLILWGWVLTQYPFILPPTLTVRDAAAPHITLQLLVYGLVGGAVLLVPSLAYLFATFTSADRSAARSRPRQ